MMGRVAIRTRATWGILWKSPSPSTERQQTHDVEPRTLLVHFVREQVGLTGTNIGCDTSSCGACSVHLNGEAVKSCTVLAVQADGQEIRTIEGMADADGTLHPMQQAFMENHGLQCGYCTPGMVMAASEPAAREPEPDRGRGPPRPRGQPVPLHRLPQHRQVGARRSIGRRLSARRRAPPTHRSLTPGN